MKVRPQLLLLAGGTALALGACATLGLRHSGVTFHDAYVEIHPGTNISPEDQKALEKVLRHYDSSLYKIRRTENGRVRTYGRLKDVLTENRLLAEVGTATGIANSALQIGTQAHPDQTSHPNHNNHPEQNDHPQQNNHPQQNDHPQHNDHPTSTLHQDHPQQIGFQICAELVNRVTPILKKYSHD
jgi:hypothetical protein